MIPVLCFTHEGRLPADTTDGLGADLEAFARRSFEDEASIRWVIVPDGGGFTAGAPSTTVVVSIRANRSLDGRARTDLLLELSELCTARTGKAPSELVLSVLDTES